MTITILAVHAVQGTGRATVHYWHKGEWKPDKLHIQPEVMTITEALKQAHLAAATRDNLTVYVVQRCDTVDEVLVATVKSEPK